MKKKIVLLLAAILCLSMLLASCDWLGRKGEATFNSIVNPDWAGMDEDKLSVLSPNGEVVDIKGRYNYVYKGNYLVTEDHRYENGVTEPTRYIYEMPSANLILTLENKRETLPQANGETFIRERVTEYYIDIIDEDSFAVLTVAYDYIDEYYRYYENYGYTFDSDHFWASNIPNVNAEDYMMSDLGIDINMDTRIDVYADASSSPVNTFSWDVIGDWTDDHNSSSYFDDSYESTIRNAFEDEEKDGYEIGYDLVVKGTKVYRVDEDDNETLVKDFGASAIPTNIYTETEEYYIGCYYSYNYYSSEAYVFYDKNLNEVFTYVAPQYFSGEEMGETQVHVLNNGNLLVQYSKGLEADAKKYDYHVPTYYGEARYDLVTLIVDPETGKETEIDLDYVVTGVSIAYDAKTDRMCWAEGVENIVYATPIEDKLVRNDAAAVDWLNMTNDGKVKGSVKFDASLTSAPVAIGGSYLSAQNVNGETVIFNTDGEVLNTIKYSTQGLEIIDEKYIVLSEQVYESGYGYRTVYQAMYDIAGNKLYDFEEKKAEIHHMFMGYDAFITRYNDKGEIKYDVVFKGEVVDSFTLDDGFIAVDEMTYERQVKTGVDENGDDVYEYRRYNVKGELMLTSENDINNVVEADDYLIVYTMVEDDVTNETEIKYYRFSAVKI